MKIAVLSAAGSSHTVKIVNSLAKRGHTVTLYSLPEHRDTDGAIDAAVTVVYLQHQSYSKDHKALKAMLINSKADVLYAHYATGYGLLARKAGFQPTVLAVWGSDVYEFPHKSPLHAYILRKNLAFPKVIFSTSRIMAEHTRVFTKKDIVITPFGVDVNTFKPAADERPADKPVRIGYLKSVAPVYGISDLIHAFHKLAAKELGVAVELAVYGDGEQLEEMKQLTASLGLEQQVTFYGRVPHAQAPEILQQMDILCVPSLRESFGVSAVEAMACGVPCVVSEADGLQEVTKDGVTGLTVPCGQPQALCDALAQLVTQPELRHQMGLAGRKHVEEHYDWDKNIQLIEEALRKASDSVGGTRR